MIRPHGLRGAVVMELWTNRPERLAQGARLDGGSRTLEVRDASPARPSAGHERWVVSFGGVEDREGAEVLRGVVLRAEPLEDSEALWVHELVGSSVVDQAGVGMGTVEAVEANPASDLLVLSGGALVPLRFVTATRPGEVVVDVPPGLLEL